LQPKTCIIICGPTAIGKTAVAIDVATHFNTAIISADSRQCYRELNIGVARPSPEELHKVKHYFIASHSIHQNITAAHFERYALEKVNDIFKQKQVAVMVGGTGLYIKAFCQGLDAVPAIPEKIRATLQQEYEEKGLAWLTAALQEKDPFYASEGEMKNPQRMLRALEVMVHTGVSIKQLQKGNREKRDFNIVQVCLQLPREILYQKINRRVDAMMEQGLVNEVKSLYAYRHLNALQTVGYSELFDFLDGKISLLHAVQLIKQHTRNYAKRQDTWFKKQPGMLFSNPDVKSVIDMLKT